MIIFIIFIFIFFLFFIFCFRVCLHVNFVAPLFLILLWVTPIVQGPLLAGSWKDPNSKDSQPV